MGRELKRVALDFDWPLHKVWPGYVCPYSDEDDAYDAWEQEEPPAGEGYQVWENVSDGSPISPVFATADEVVAWLIGQGHTAAGSRRFVETGYAPSMMFSPRFGLQNGIDALGYD